MVVVVGGAGWGCGLWRPEELQIYIFPPLLFIYLLAAASLSVAAPVQSLANFFFFNPPLKEFKTRPIYTLTSAAVLSGA